MANIEAKTMTEDRAALSSEEPAAPKEGSTPKQRRKRKWDQADESLVSCGVVIPGVLPMSTVGSPAVSFQGILAPSLALSTNPVNPSIVSLSKGIQAPLLPQQAAVAVQKLNQKIQEDLMIAREIVINDADPAIRYKLTKRQTQEEIQKCTGAVVITRGKYRPPNAVPDGEKALYLHISAGAHMKETAERIRVVDRAAAMVEEMLKQVPQPLSTCVYLGFEADLSLNIAARIRGPNDQYINHIINETGVTVLLRGCGSGCLGNTGGEEGQQPLHVFLSSNNQKSLEDARLLAENLLDTISRECGTTRASSCKVYSAVPPPQQFLIGVQSSGTEMNSILSSATSLPCSAASTVPAVSVSSVVASVVTTAFPFGQVTQPGGLVPSSHSQTNGLPFSQPLLTCCTSYSAYAGIYPQATPLQQVALALRQSGPVTSIVAPATPVVSMVHQSSSETEKRPQQKRKFQESPAAPMGVSISQQGSGVEDPRKSSSSLEKIGTLLRSSKKLDMSSNGTLPTSLKSVLPPPPPSPPKNIPSTALPASNSLLPPPPPPPPLPKFTSSASVSRASDEDNILNKSNSTAVPDTLVKLMEYGEDDDDPEDENESFKSNPNRIAAPKPFWAV